MISTKKLLYKTIERLGIINDFVIEQGIDSSWYYRKWNSGRFDAERTWNIGQVTLSNAEGTTHMVGNEITTITPSAMVSGSVDVNYYGNSSSSATFLEKIANNKFRIAKVGTTSVTLQNVTVVLRTVGAKWKS